MSDSSKHAKGAKTGEGQGKGRGGNAPPVEHQWQPGQSGNPNGGPKGPHLATVVQRILNGESTIEDCGRKLSRLEAMVIRQVIKAIDKDDTHAFNAIMDRLAGKPNQQIEGSGTINFIASEKWFPRPPDEVAAEDAD